MSINHFLLLFIVHHFLELFVVLLLRSTKILKLRLNLSIHLSLNFFQVSQAFDLSHLTLKKPFVVKLDLLFKLDDLIHILVHLEIILVLAMRESDEFERSILEDQGELFVNLEAFCGEIGMLLENHEGLDWLHSHIGVENETN